MKTFEDFLELFNAASIIEPGSPEAVVLVTPHQSLLKDLGVVVYGELEGTSTIKAFSLTHMKPVKIQRVDLIRLENLIQWFGEDIEKRVFPGNDIPVGASQTYTVTQVRKAIASEGGKKQIRENECRGAGVWETCGRLLLVGEDEVAICNGVLEKLEAQDFGTMMMETGTCEQWYDYEKLSEYVELAKFSEWRMSVLDEMTSLFALWDNWTKPHDAELMASLVFCTWLQSVWTWRPLVFVTGPTASGKSTLLEETLPKLFGHLSLFTQKASEAGLRQSIGQTSRIVSLDEFESGKDRRAILDLARTSGRGGKIVKGTTSQKASLFGIKHILWCGAIESGLSDAADRNRFIVFDLGRVQKKEGDKPLCVPYDTLEELGMKSLAVAMSIWKQVHTMAEAIQDSVIKDVDHRMVESYSLPCAMRAVIKEKNTEEAIAMTASVLSDRELNIGVCADEPDLLKAILESVVHIGKGMTSSIMELLVGNGFETKTMADTEIKLILSNNGIHEIRAYKGNPDRVFLAPGPVKRYLLRETRFKEKDIMQILKRTPGASEVVQKINKTKKRGVIISVDDLLEAMSDPGDETECETVEDGTTSPTDEIF